MTVGELRQALRNLPTDTEILFVEGGRKCRFVFERHVQWDPILHRYNAKGAIRRRFAYNAQTHRYVYCPRRDCVDGLGAHERHYNGIVLGSLGNEED